MCLSVDAHTTDLVTDRRPVQETILVIAEASAAVLGESKSKELFWS